MIVAIDHDLATILIGDSAQLGSVLPPNSIDAIVTDPPSGIAFMGKSWDRDKGGRDGWIAWLAETMAPAFAALKPGGHALVWALPRTSHWTALALELAGFEIRDRVTHLFGSGFPKSLNVSKAIDACDRIGTSRERALKFTAWMRSTGITCAAINALTASRMGSHYLTDKDQPAVATADMMLPMRPHLPPVPEEIEELVRWRTVESENSENMKRRRVVGADAARQWDGWGTALKPAAEDWWLVRKPLGGTVAACVLEHGTGALNIDASRVGSAGGGPAVQVCGRRDEHGRCLGHENAGQSTSGATFHSPAGDESLGRWPAHVVFSHTDACVLVATSTAALEREVYRCAPGCAVAELDAQSGTSKDGVAVNRNRKPGTMTSWLGTRASQTGEDVGYGGKGGASRFFYCAKPAKSETELGLEHLPIRTSGEMTDREDGSAGLSSPRAGAGRGGGRRNFHPCLPPGEVVRAIDGWRAIETVRVGDRVMAHDGTWRRVTEAFAKPCDDEVVTIAVDGENRTSTLTTNHPMLVWRPVKKRNSIVGAEIDWQDAGDVRVGDYTMTPVMKSGVSSDHTAGWWWALGLWLAEGSTLSNGKNDHRYPQLALHQNETDLVERLRATFGAERVRAYPSTTTLGQTAVIFVPGLVDEWVAWCGHGALAKRVPEQVWAQDDERRRALLDGYLAGDGCVQRGAPRAKSASEDLAAGICTLAEACGYRATSYRWDSETGRTTIQGRDVADNGHVAMYLGTVEHLRRPNLVEHEGVRYTLRRVKAIARQPYRGPVYNLTVEGAHTFQVRIGMSHNTKKSVALMQYLIRLITPPNGVVLDVFAGSGTTGVAALGAGFRFVGVEQGGDDEEYVPILLGRIEHALRNADAKDAK